MMMVEPHAPTIFLVTVIISITMTLLLAAGGSRSNRDGLLPWSLTLALHTLAFVLFGLRGDAKNITLTLLAVSSLSASWAMFAEGLFQFQQRRPPRILIWLPVLLTAIVFSLFRENAALRISLSSAIYCVQNLLVLTVLYQGRQVTVGRGQYFIAAGLAPVTPVFAFRCFLAATGQVEKILLPASNRVQAMSYLLSIISTLMISIGMLIMCRERSEERCRLLAEHDPLTALANRRGMDETLSKEWANAKRNEKPLSLVLLDVDFFKKYNDHYGHQAGDTCLQNVATALLTNALRDRGLAARYGGEEFLLAWPDTDGATAMHLAQGLCVAIAALNIPHEQSPFRCVTVSVGIATLAGNRYQDVGSLLGAADAALYLAKQSGRNQVQAAPGFATHDDLEMHTQGGFA